MTADEIAELRRVVTVKPLEWNEAREARPYQFWYAASSVGRYEIDVVSTGSSTRYDVFLRSVRFSIKENLAEAKDASQADYERRIFSALTLASRALPVAPDAVPFGWIRNATILDVCEHKKKINPRLRNFCFELGVEIMRKGEGVTIFTEDQVTRLCDQAKREAYEKCVAVATDHEHMDRQVAKSIRESIEALAEKKP